MIAEGRRRRDEFLTHVPADLRPAVAAAVDADEGEGFVGLMLFPFARWAPPMLAGYELPRRLLEWVLDPPRRYWMGHNCERCGLAVPLLTTWSNDPDPPSSVVAFPECPACRGRTTHAASYGPADKKGEGGCPCG
jgi:hypothetical protein